ncbi:hypothetical protein TNCV_3043051 [Trichonephila clavipes]|nr:hypothetical protein TNCV_3043051 [Trichonephila clavipes]
MAVVKGCVLKFWNRSIREREKQSENGMQREVLRFESGLLQVGFLLREKLCKFVANMTSCRSENTVAISLRVEFGHLALTENVGSRHSIDCCFNSGTWPYFEKTLCDKSIRHFSTKAEFTPRLSASSVKRLANQRLHLGRNEASDWLDARNSTFVRIGVNEP